MKIRFILCALIVFLSLHSKAQNYVTIPDTNFAAWLNIHYSSCMNGNQLDTSCIWVKNEHTLTPYDQNISDLSGVECFTNLLVLLCDYNPLTTLPTLPNSLEMLICNNCQISSLPNLPNTLQTLVCNDNQLSSLPPLPSSLLNLDCWNNQLTALPLLPNALFELFCQNNLITSLPDLPDSLHYLNCKNNLITCFPKFPNTIEVGFFDIDSNLFTCLPNYINAMNAATLAHPLCVQGDTLFNQNGCDGVNSISGYTYQDNNSNCFKDTGEQGLVNIPIKLYENNNNMLLQMSSFTSGIYYFELPVDTYTVSIDTTGMPFEIQCANPGTDSTVTLTATNPLANNVNFNFTCKQGFDIGTQSVVATGAVFPGQQHILKVVAGDMGNWYNMNCVAGISGQVLVTVTGPVTYIGPAMGALTPMVTGGIFIYPIADFGNVNNANDFNLIFKTDTNAQTGDSICVNVIVTPSTNDNNMSNNTYAFCYHVVNSLDPNMKEVYPIDVLPGYDDYFTYTIHFQNTGTAPAYNIRLVDTLSNNLNPETFQLINYSHNNIVSLTDRILTFRFPNIMLPDSSSDEPGSKGFVQYKIKPNASLVVGTQIENTAYIYFDYNLPIATNTTINEFRLLSIENTNISSYLNIYPNPVTDLATLTYNSSTAQNISISIFDMLGREVLHLNRCINAGTNNISINTQTLNKGVYMLVLNQGQQGNAYIKFVK